MSLQCVWLVVNKAVLAWNATDWWDILHSVLTILFIGKKECLVRGWRIIGTILYVFMFRQQNARQNYNIETANESFVRLADFEYLGASRIKIASTKKLKADQRGKVRASIPFRTSVWCLET